MRVSSTGKTGERQWVMSEPFDVRDRTIFIEHFPKWIIRSEWFNNGVLANFYVEDEVSIYVYSEHSNA